MNEEVLKGGNLSHVVRVADTVRRPTGFWTPAVHALLNHLESSGFDQAPKVLGIDERNREILTYLSGRTAGQHPWPDWVWADELLISVAKMLRRYHDAMSDFVQPQDTRWRLTDERCAQGEIICHNDVAPYNLVVQADGKPALIDWDVAGPGSPCDDLAFAAYSFAPIDNECCGNGRAGLLSRAPRIKLLLDTYGLDQRDHFVQAIISRLGNSVSRITSAAAAGDENFQRLIDSGLLIPVTAAISLLEEHGNALLDQLS